MLELKLPRHWTYRTFNDLNNMELLILIHHEVASMDKAAMLVLRLQKATVWQRLKWILRGTF